MKAMHVSICDMSHHTLPCVHFLHTALHADGLCIIHYINTVQHHYKKQCDESRLSHKNSDCAACGHPAARSTCAW